MSENEQFIASQESTLEGGSEQLIQTVREAIPGDITLALESTEVNISAEDFAVVEAGSADVAEVAGFAASENSIARKLASESTLATVLASAEEEPVSQETSAKPQQGSSWLQKKMYIAAAALGMFAAAQPALAGDHNGLRDQVRAELQLQAGTAVNNGLNSLIQIGVNRIAQSVGVPMPQQVYGPQPGVVVVGGGLPPPPGGVYQRGGGYDNGDIRSVRSAEVGNLEQTVAAHQGYAATYYREMMSYYQSYQATGRKGDGDMYLMKKQSYESEMGKLEAAQRSLDAARRNMVNGR